ncbi:MAG: hypothetical protein ACYDGN_17430 [Acidimicrobiales bacterium]
MTKLNHPSEIEDVAGVEAEDVDGPGLVCHVFPPSVVRLTDTVTPLDWSASDSVHACDALSASAAITRAPCGADTPAPAQPVAGVVRYTVGFVNSHVAPGTA